MLSRSKIALIWIAIAIVGGAAFSALTASSFWTGALVVLVCLAINGWIAEKFDDW